jgi:deoxyribodipyrimidine photo-lyase
MESCKIREVDTFSNFIFLKNTNLEKCNEYIPISKVSTFYKINKNIHVNGGRSLGLKILQKINNFKNYDECRNYFNYSTTSLSAYNHFTVISIREVYYAVVKKLGIKSGIINELHWRDFYSNITHFYPRVLQGQLKKKGIDNIPFKEKYEKLEWDKNDKWFKAWCNGETGYPLVDASMNQLNITGYMHNRGRMIVSMFLTKSMLLDFRLGEKYFAQKLVDYSPMQNSGGWMWSSSMGTDSVPYFRTMNYITQAEKYDKDEYYVKKWNNKKKNIPQILDQKEQRIKMFQLFKTVA